VINSLLTLIHQCNHQCNPDYTIMVQEMLRLNPGVQE